MTCFFLSDIARYIVHLCRPTVFLKFLACITYTFFRNNSNDSSKKLYL